MQKCPVCARSHGAVAQVSHVAGVAEQFSKHVRRGFLSALQHPHCLVTAALDTHTHTQNKIRHPVSECITELDQKEGKLDKFVCFFLCI